MRSHTIACADFFHYTLPIASSTILISPPSNTTRSEGTFHLGDLSGQGDHLTKSVVVTGHRFGQLHVGALQALVKYVHDLGSDVADIRVLLSP
jgi:hypothetical protein